MRYGRSVPKGWLPVHSVWTEEQARELLIIACPKNAFGQFVAPELEEEQTLDNLDSFGRRLARLDEDHGISLRKPKESELEKLVWMDMNSSVSVATDSPKVWIMTKDRMAVRQKVVTLVSIIDGEVRVSGGKRGLKITPARARRIAESERKS